MVEVSRSQLSHGITGYPIIHSIKCLHCGGTGIREDDDGLWCVACTRPFRGLVPMR